jgi:UDPglucose 6-dehydrogenase
MGTRIAVIGSGYVGSVVAVCLAHVGHDVIGVESDPDKLAELSEGSAPFHEPGLDPLLQRGLRGGHLRFTDDFREAMDASDVVFVCVGTPPGPDGEADMSAIRGVARSIAENLRHYHVIITKSTVPIGTGHWLGSLIEDIAGPAVRSLFRVLSNPEFLREGNAVQDFLHPDRVVLGSDDPRALEVAADIYRPILEQRIPGDVGRRDPVPLLQTKLATAEMIKYASNAFLATKISFANEIARLCDFVDADITEVTAGMGLDTRIGGRFLDAGLGWGGSCFGKDLSALVETAREYGYRPRILEGAISVNESQRHLVIEQLLQHLKTLRGAKICILGLAFKPDTDDLRDSPALDVALRLLGKGTFVSAYDPMVTLVPEVPDIRMMPNAFEAASGADAIVLATEWPQFLSYDLTALRRVMRGDLFFDGRNNFDPQLVEQAGFRYVGIGRRSPVATPKRMITRPGPGPEQGTQAEPATIEEVGV